MFVGSEHFDIVKIADSGQCFRMTENKDGTYGLIYKGKYLEIKYHEDKSAYELECDEDEYEKVWKDYFDMSFDYFDYEKIESAVDPQDTFLVNAVKYGKGIRILRQDPWEMLVSFIISQRKSIPAIRTSIEKLCALCGDEIQTKRGIRYAFPSAEKVAGLSDDELALCSIGYRSKYIASAAEAAASGKIDLDKLFYLTDDELKEELLKLYGVGVKVASCIMLFAYHRLDAFPEDVWIKRAVANEYPGGFPAEMYSGYAGIMQQYIFFYMRNTYKRQ